MKQIPADVKVMHYRFRDSQGNLLAGGGVTQAYRTTSDGKIALGTAKCHPNDNYNKHQGRMKAAGRSFSKKAVTFEGTEQEFLAELDRGLAQVNQFLRAVHGLSLERHFNGRRKKAAVLEAPAAATDG